MNEEALPFVRGGLGGVDRYYLPQPLLTKEGII